MNHEILKSFINLDQEVFTQIIKHYGYTAAAVYRVLGKNLVYVLGSDADEANKWPASASFSSDYTPRKRIGMPLGWTKPQLNIDTKKLWPKGVSFYFPAQDWSAVKLVFVVRNALGKRTKLGELDGPLEAMAATIAAWIDHREIRHFVSEAQFTEQMRRLNTEVQYLIDHELRTPLTSIMGYTALLSDADREQLSEYGQIVSQESQRALNSLQRLSHAFKVRDESIANEEVETIELSKLCTHLCDTLKEQASLVTSELLSERLQLSLRIASDQNMQLRGVSALVRSAIWEVLKNAAAYTSSGRIDLTLYASDQTLVLDIEDDGVGVSPGAEDLIFLRFFQGPLAKGSRRVKRGLGIGLYLARCIAEQHGGSLTFVRGVGKNGVFRFMWPRSDAQSEANSPYSQAS